MSFVLIFVRTTEGEFYTLLALRKLQAVFSQQNISKKNLTFQRYLFFFTILFFVCQNTFVVAMRLSFWCFYFTTDVFDTCVIHALFQFLSALFNMTFPSQNGAKIQHSHFDGFCYYFVKKQHSQHRLHTLHFELNLECISISVYFSHLASRTLSMEAKIWIFRVVNYFYMGVNCEAIVY
jgi:hypothetical protein